MSHLYNTEDAKHMFFNPTTKTNSDNDIVRCGFVSMNHGCAGQEMITDNDILALDDDDDDLSMDGKYSESSEISVSSVTCTPEKPIVSKFLGRPSQ